MKIDKRAGGVLLAALLCAIGLSVGALADGEPSAGAAETAVSVSVPRTGTPGWRSVGGQWVYYTGDGTLKESGWQFVGGVWYYFENGVMLSGTERQIGGSVYRFAGSGAMVTGWRYENGRWQYYAGNGVRKESGWEYSGGAWYYFEDGAMLSGTEAEIDGSVYRFAVSGAMVTGWRRTNGVWQYYAGNGVRKESGWEYSGGAWYYFEDGAMLSDTEAEIGGSVYRFAVSGAMVTGWRYENGRWQYYAGSGARVDDGWARSGGRWYYFSGGVMQTGWLTLSSGVFWFDDNGVMATGWKRLDDHWYYFDASGYMLTGWHELGDYTYYFYGEADESGEPHGAMAVDTTVGGTKIRSDGAALTKAEIYMRSAAQNYASATNWLILVDTGACKVGVFYGSSYHWTLQSYWTCSPGKPSTPTVKGVFTVGLRGTYFDSGSARCWWYTQFCGNYLFHSVLYNKDGSIQDGRLGQQLSHGCVRLAYGRAYWIYDNIPTGTKVVVY